MPRKGKYKPHRKNLMYNCDNAEIFRNSAAVLDDVDPMESLRYMKEIFKNKIDEDVIAMIFSECAYDVNQAYETLISLSNEDGTNSKSESVMNKEISKKQVFNAQVNQDSCSSGTEKDLKSLFPGTSMPNSELNASNFVPVVHGGLTYFVPPSKNIEGASNSSCHIDKPESFLSSYFTPPANYFPSLDGKVEDSNSKSFSDSIPQFITPFLPTPTHKFASPPLKDSYTSVVENNNVLSFSASNLTAKSSPQKYAPSNASYFNSKNKRNDDLEILNAIEKIKSGAFVMVILRGLPGSGKSTLAKKMRFSGVVYSTDDYFYNRGKYTFDPSKLSEAHEWNKKRTLKAIEKGITPIIIDNTNVETWEMYPYAAMGLKHEYEIIVLEPNTPWKFKVHDLSLRNTHGVSKGKISQMKERYQLNVTVDEIIKSREISNVISKLESSVSNRNKQANKVENSVSLETLVPQTTKSSDFNNSASVSQHSFPVNYYELSKANFMPHTISAKAPISEENTDNFKVSDDCKNVKPFSLENENFYDDGITSDEKGIKSEENILVSISNLDELRALIREDSEESQSQISSTQDVSGWELITEPDDDFLWSVEEANSIKEENKHQISTISEELKINDSFISEENELVEMFDKCDNHSSSEKGGFKTTDENDLNTLISFIKQSPEIAHHEKSSSENVKGKIVEKNSTDVSNNISNFNVLSSNIDGEQAYLSSKSPENNFTASPRSLVHKNVIQYNSWCEIDNNFSNSSNNNELNQLSDEKCLFKSNYNESTLPLWDDINDENYSMSLMTESIPISDKSKSNNNIYKDDENLFNSKVSTEIEPKPQRDPQTLQFNVSKCSIKKINNPLKIDENLFLESKPWEDDTINDPNSNTIVENQSSFIPKPPRTLQERILDENKITNSVSFENKVSYNALEKSLKNRLCANFNHSLKLFNNEWILPEYVSSDTETEEVLKSEINIVMPPKETVSTQTEPQDFVAAHKVSIGESISPDYLVMEAKHEINIKSEANEHPLLHQEVIAHLPKFEKSTSTEDMLEDAKINEKLKHLQECFPDISEEDLLHLLEICHNDDTWLSNLLLEWGYKYNVKMPLLKQVEETPMDANENNPLNGIDNVSFESKTCNDLNLSSNTSFVDDDSNVPNLPEESKPFEKIMFVLEPSFALQLEELFGPVTSSNEGCLSTSNYAVEVDLNFAEQIYQKWKETINAQKEIKFPKEIKLGKVPNLPCKQNKSQISCSSKERNGSNEPLPLSEIMDMEYALQIHKQEKLKRDMDFSTKLKRLELYDLFPGADQMALDEIFEHNNFNLEDTVTALGEDIGQPKTEVQEKKIKKIDECVKEWCQADVFKEFALGDWSDWVYKEDNPDSFEEVPITVFPSVPPEVLQLRDLAAKHYHQRQECVQKAQAAYCKGMKDVASFYAQQGQEYSLKFKEINKMASDLISQHRKAASPNFVLDLHGFYIQEAIPALEKFLRERKLELKKKQQTTPQIVSVITGQGVHSLRGPRLLPVVLKFLKKSGYGFNEINPGMLEVTLIPD